MGFQASFATASVEGAFGFRGGKLPFARWEVIPPKHDGVFSRGNSSQKMVFSKNLDMKK